MKKFLYKSMLIIVCILLLLSTVVFATSEKQIEIMPKKSATFLKWEKMSKEERKNTIQPSYYAVSLKDSIKRSTYNKYILGESTSNESFNLAEVLTEISPINVKNQQKTGACWAFSYSNVIETTLANKYNRQVMEYSPMHIDYMTGTTYNRLVGEGGNFLIALAYGASGLGPVYEQDFPFENVYDEENNSQDKYYLEDISNIELNQAVRARIEETTIFAPIYKSYSTNSITYKDSDAWFGYNTYKQEEVDAVRQLIKKHIRENGAVTASFYSDMGIIANDEIVSQRGYFNNQTNSYYCDSTINSANHAVTIVGWDDNYSKNNFSENKKPLNDGAYIVLNSWGNEFGDNGYFYVSYDDAFIEQSICGIDEIKEKETIEQEFYDNIYEYDELGANYALISLNEDATAYLDSGYAANVFSRKQKEKTEYLSEIGIFLLNTQGVEIYVNPANDNLEDCQLVATHTGTEALESGYHTLKLASPVKLTGEEFVVKIKYINSELVQIPIECNLYESGLTEEIEDQYVTATANAGESLISFNGTAWSDLDDYSKTYYAGTSNETTIAIKDTNACIKAFTTLSEGETPSTIAVTGVTLDKETVTIKEGQTTNLVATVLPENATNQNITWTSNNESVATVENGVITGISEGIATIIVTTEDGNFTDNCVVTVEKVQVVPETVAVTGVTLNKETVTLKEGKTTSLVATVLPENATNKNITWTSSDNNVATVKNGVITGVSEGTATITVKTLDGNFTDTCVVTVEKEELIIGVTGVKLDKESIEMQVGEKNNLVATIQPINATTKEVTWSSSNEQVAKINESGIIEALKEGKATITVTTKDGKFTASCEITVSAKVNTDDDIYTENEKQPGKTEQAEDSTTAKGEIPKAGTKTLISIVGILIVTTIVVYIKNKKYEDIK